MPDEKAKQLTKQLILLILLLFPPFLFAFNLSEDLLLSTFSPIKIFFLICPVVLLVYIIGRFFNFYKTTFFESSPKPLQKEKQAKITKEDLTAPDKKSILEKEINRKRLDVQEILIILSLLFASLALTLLTLT